MRVSSASARCRSGDFCVGRTSPKPGGRRRILMVPRACPRGSICTSFFIFWKRLKDPLSRGPEAGRAWRPAGSGSGNGSSSAPAAADCLILSTFELPAVLLCPSKSHRDFRGFKIPETFCISRNKTSSGVTKLQTSPRPAAARPCGARKAEERVRSATILGGLNADEAHPSVFHCFKKISNLIFIQPSIFK